MKSVRNFLGALYGWSAALYFGAVLIDVVYASLLREADGAFIQPVFGEVADFLLLLAVPVVFTALAATALSWDVPGARNLFLASLLVFALEFIVPIFLFPLLKTFPNSPDAGISPYLRLAPLTVASVLALGGYRNLFR